MADLDHFKRINDTLGHCAGDKVLQDFAALLRQECRKEDLPARSGGEEFLILLPMTNLEEARLVGKRICASTQGISVENGPVTVSIGAVQYKQGGSAWCISQTRGRGPLRGQEKRPESGLLYRVDLRSPWE